MFKIANSISMLWSLLQIRSDVVLLTVIWGEVLWMTCCCYLFHLLHQTFHLLVHRSSIKFHIDWFHIVNCVFYSNKCISGVRPPPALTFLSVALSLQKVGHPCPRSTTLQKHIPRSVYTSLVMCFCNSFDNSRKINDEAPIRFIIHPPWILKRNVD